MISLTKGGTFSSCESFAPMALQTFRPFLYLGLAASVTLASVAAQSAATGTTYTAEAVAQATPAEDLFDDAPYGVDPMVTGPVSAAFKRQQQAAGCDNAVWPNIPAACYPK